MLADLNIKIGKEKIYTPIAGKESVHKVSKNNGIRVINFAAVKDLIIYYKSNYRHGISSKQVYKRERDLSVGNLRFERINEFKYLGRKINERNKVSIEIHKTLH